MIVLISKKVQKDYNRIGRVTIIENGILTVALFNQTVTRVSINHVIQLEEDSISDDSSDDYEGSVRSYVSVYDGESNYKVDEYGKTIGYHTIYDSDDNTIKSYESESSESESSESESSKKD